MAAAPRGRALSCWAATIPLSWHRQLKNCSVPVVVTGQRFPDVACVYNDDHTAARELTQRMLEHGRRRSFTLAAPNGTMPPASQRPGRRAGCLEGRRAGWRPAAPHLLQCIHRGRGAALYAGAADPLPVSGWCGLRDRYGGLWRHACAQAGRTADRPGCGPCRDWRQLGGQCDRPGLATVRFYQKQVGQEAARILLQMLEEKEYGGPVRQVTLGYQVVERGSL